MIPILHASNWSNGQIILFGPLFFGLGKFLNGQGEREIEIESPLSKPPVVLISQLPSQLTYIMHMKHIAQMGRHGRHFNQQFSLHVSCFIEFQ